MVSKTENYQAIYQSIVDAHRAEMDRNLAEFHRQYGERVKQLEEIIQQASSKEAGTKQRTNPDHSGHHRADDKQSGGDTTEQPTNYSTYERTKPTARPPRGGGIRSIRS